MAIQNDKHRILILNDSQVIVNPINGKISVSKNIVNLMDDIRRLSVPFRESTIEYCNGVINSETD